MGVLKDLFKDYRFTISFTILVVLLFFALLSFFSPYDPTFWGNVPRDRPPSLDNFLGTNSKGQDVFWQATFAVRNSLIIALIAASVSRVIAVLVGMVAGYKGGLTGSILGGCIGTKQGAKPPHQHVPAHQHGILPLDALAELRDVLELRIQRRACPRPFLDKRREYK